MIANTRRNLDIPRIKVRDFEPPRRQGRQEIWREKMKNSNFLLSLFPWRPWRLGGSILPDEAAFEGEGGGGDAVGDAEFAQEAADVLVHRAAADREEVRDLLIARTL